MTDIKFCENNFDHGVEQLIEKLENESDDINVSVEPCLGHCGECAEGPFALVDDDFVQAETPEELYDEILERVK